MQNTTTGEQSNEAPPKTIGALSAALIVGISVGVGGLVAAGASDHTTALAGLSLPWIALIIAFVVQWVAFVPAFARATEHFYDLTGSVTYLALIAVALAFGNQHGRSILLAVLVSAWALRLGSFLFRRVRRAGSDGRFDEIKKSAPRFLVAWTVQGLWVFLTLCAAIAAMAAAHPAPLGAVEVVGLVVWIVGFAIEVIADRQKSNFRAENPTGFIASGLWSWSRHPNYFGEIVLWTGIAVIAAGTLQGWQWVTMISPVFVTLLLTLVSGVPLLEERADDRWGENPEYQAYKASTSVLIPWPRRRT